MILTDSERRVLVALAEIQPTTARDLARRLGLSSVGTVVGIVRKLRRRDLVMDDRYPGLPLHPARSLRLADGVVVTARGRIGRWVAL